MGKCLRSCKQQRPSPPPAAVEAAAYLTLRSGRRVPDAASPRRRHRRGGGRRCGKSATASASAAARQRRRRRVLNPLRGREVEEELPPSLLENYSHVVCGQGCGDRRDTPHSGDVKHDHDNSRVAGRPSSPPEAEIEAFFAAAELAERRRFAETYNYDVALDRPFEGRYEWAPVSARGNGAARGGTVNS